MIGGPLNRLPRRLTAALLLGAVLLMGAAAVLLHPFGTGPAVALGSPSPASSSKASTTPSASLSAQASATAKTSPTATSSPTHSAAPTVTPVATHPPAPISHSAPVAAGYFGLRPVGNWASLPSDAQCAAQVHDSTWEPRPQNAQQNSTKPAPGAMAASFATRPRNVGGSYNPLWDSWLLKRVDGQFTGTTDEILQWAACKWGLPDNLARADAAVESTWFQYLHYPADASSGGGGGSCYWDYGCGDAFSASSSASTLYCNSIAHQGLLASEVHDYQKDPKTGAGGYPWIPGPGLCPKTFSILGVMSWDDPAWEAPYPAWAGNQNGTFPFTRDSTAAAVDYWGAYVRGCYEGWAYWLKGSGTGNYAAGDLWGCIGSWYSGDWHTSAANTYIAKVQQNENSHIWLQAEFDDPRQQYQCDARYGCAS